MVVRDRVSLALVVVDLENHAAAATLAGLERDRLVDLDADVDADHAAPHLLNDGRRISRRKRSQRAVGKEQRAKSNEDSNQPGHGSPQSKSYVWNSTVVYC